MLGSGFTAMPASSSALIASNRKKSSDKDKEDPPEDPCPSIRQDETDDGAGNGEQSFRSKRIELFYYRNAKNLIEILNNLLAQEPGCAISLPQNEIIQAGTGVGRGGGNIILLYGTEDYIDDAHRLIASLDLPLSGIDLQLWGIQISSGKPDKLAEVMVDVRGEISLTQQLVRDTFGRFQLGAKTVLEDASRFDQDFKDIVDFLQYEDVLSNRPRRLSILDVFLIGKAVKDPVRYYKELYSLVVSGEIVEGRFKASDERYQDYFDAMKERGTPPFERLFRSRGLKPVCEIPSPDDGKCELWDWVEIFDGAVKSSEIASRRPILEFALYYADFVTNPNLFNPGELQRTSSVLNGELQHITNLLQNDIEDLFVRPTLTYIQDRVGRTRSVSFAQVGRTTIATLSGVKTVVNSQSHSTVAIPESQNLTGLLTRITEIQDQLPDLPASTFPGAASPELIGLVAALAEQRSLSGSIQTGTNLTFTPGVLRDLNSAELNIQLTVTDPTFTSTQSDDSVNISRVGTQTVETTVYTRALDFFDLSTFTSQATLNGGRVFFPVIGQLWQAIFGSIPVFGNLFSFQRAPQNVLHESLLLTNSFITPTSLGLGSLYYPVKEGEELNKEEYFCWNKIALFKYLDSLNFSTESPFNFYDQASILDFPSYEDARWYLTLEEREKRCKDVF
ncbi:MAG: hypothetical protein QNJ46_21890 [Leptolyngbyaceae cyanobacterium MO_188.B28]|nr:hypothetical protein [Leptolyngbyaceae cyanobacterium MO_188.B28]